MLLHRLGEHGNVLGDQQRRRTQSQNSGGKGKWLHTILAKEKGMVGSVCKETIGEVQGGEDETARKVGLLAEVVCKKMQIQSINKMRIKKMVGLTLLILILFLILLRLEKRLAGA